MPTGTRRELLATCAVFTAGGCMERPETTEEQTDDTADGAADDGSEGTAEPGGREGAEENASSSDGGAPQNETSTADAESEATLPANVWFHTDRVRQELNTFDVSVRIELRDSTKVRVEAAYFTETYTDSGTHTDVARVDLGTTLRAEAYTDGEWHDVNVAEAPVRNSDGVGT